MDLVRPLTTRPPPVGAGGGSGVAFQRNITISILVAGIAGGLLLVLSILFLCKFCRKLRNATRDRCLKDAGEGNGAVDLHSGHLANTHSGGGGTDHRRETEAILLKEVTWQTSGHNFNSGGRAVEVVIAGSTPATSTTNGPPLSTAATSRNQQQQNRLPIKKTSVTSTGAPAGLPSSSAMASNPPTGSAVVATPSLHQSGMDATGQQSTINTGSKDDGNAHGDSYAIQAEPMRMISTSPLADDSWASTGDEASHHHHGRHATVASSEKTSESNWNRTPRDQLGGTNRKNLRHAASHPSGRDGADCRGDPLTVSKRRSDWRNSHRNYRSTPTSTSASRDAYITYEFRRALRDQHLNVSDCSQPSTAAGSYSSPGRRLLPKRSGSMREPGNTEVTGQLHQQLQRGHSPRHSPSNKRWRCHTVDCPCGIGPMSASRERLLMAESALTGHRHSFPATDGSHHHNRQHPSHHHYHSSSHQHSGHVQHHTDDFPAANRTRSKEIPYDDYANRSDTLDWNGFHSNKNAVNEQKDDSGSHDDVPGSQQQKQQQPSDVAGPAPRITIRYNDTGSLESVNEENIFFCLEADSKIEFRERLEKTIHAQYRKVWELRANLEERGEFFEMPSSPEPEILNSEDGMMEMPIVNQTVSSFDSNLETIPDDDRSSAYSDAESPNPASTITNKSSDLLFPTGASNLTADDLWKKPTYRAMGLNARMIQRTSRQSPQQAQSSFDSIDTVETSSTEAKDQVTTSFDSSATDSTNGPDGFLPHAPTPHRMLTSLRGDSGYRSLEVAPTTQPANQGLVASSAVRLTQSQGAALNEGGAQQPHADCQCVGDIHDEKCEREKPVVFARCTRYGLAKNRSTSVTAQPTPSQQTPSHQTPLQHMSSLPSQQQHRTSGWAARPQRSAPPMLRDYSIDERTDAIFREFSRCDPVYDSKPATSGSPGGRNNKEQTPARPGGYRWLNHHRRERRQLQQHHHGFMSLQIDLPMGNSIDTSDGLQQHCSVNE